jgi:hypothetical protein
MVKMAEWGTEWRNGRMTKMAEWRMEWLNGGMAEWLNGN